MLNNSCFQKVKRQLGDTYLSIPQLLLDNLPPKITLKRKLLIALLNGLCGPMVWFIGQ